MSAEISVYGRGSYWHGRPDPSDVDVVVVGTEHMEQTEAASAALPYLERVPRTLPLDVCWADRNALDVYERAVIHDGVLLAGPDLVREVPQVRPLEWATAMASRYQQLGDTSPGLAVLAGIRAVWAAEGRVVVANSAVVPEAHGGPWDSLARHAWQHRTPVPVDHPDVGELHERVCWAGAGEAVDPAWQERGWSSTENASAVLTVYRGHLTPIEVERCREAARSGGRRQHGGWAKTSCPVDGMTESLAMCAGVGNFYWNWASRMEGLEPADLHRHQPGAVFPAHVDKLPMYPTRLLNVVAMIQPATRGGQLYLNLGGQPIEPDLEPGDVVVFDSSALHGVTEVEAGERIVLVSHAHGTARQAWGPV